MPCALFKSACKVLFHWWIKMQCWNKSLTFHIFKSYSVLFIPKVQFNMNSDVASMLGARGQRTSQGPRPSLLFSLSSFSPFSLCLLGPPSAPGPLDIVHPCHPLATPLNMKEKTERHFWFLKYNNLMANLWLYTTLKHQW